MSVAGAGRPGRGPGRIRAFLSELRDRRVTQVAVGYLIVGWLTIQVAVSTFPYLGLPGWAVTLVIVLTALGFPLALVLAWAFDVTPAGVRRADGVALAEPVDAPGSIGRSVPARQPEERQPGSPTRLIVLPFRLLRPDPETDFLAFSLPDAITGALAGLRALVVRSNLAALRFAGGAPNLARLAADAEVDLILTGTLLRAGERVRVSCQLTRAADGTLLWSQESQVSLGDLFELQDQLVRRIVDSLHLPLTSGERRSLGEDVPTSARAYEFYLRANQLAVQVNEWATARDLYLESLKEDPEFAPAWARLGRCYRLIGKSTTDPAGRDENSARAEAALHRAIELNPDLAIAQNLYAQLEVDLGRAREAMVRLLGLAGAAGGSAELFAGLVHACRFCGLLDASRAAHERARQLDPVVRTSVAHTYVMLGDYEGALRTYYVGDVGYVRALALATLGREQEAMAALREGEQTMPPGRMRKILVSLRTLLEGDRRRSLAATLDLLTVERVFDRDGRFYLIRQLARLGEVERALDELEETVGSGFSPLDPLRHDPWLATLREEPRFRLVLERVEQEHHRSVTAFEQAGGREILSVGPAAAPGRGSIDDQATPDRSDLRAHQIP